MKRLALQLVVGLGLGAGLLAALIAAAGKTAWAQYSPNCLRNGVKDYCAITAVVGATTLEQSFDMITFADHTVYEVLRNETSCRRQSAAVRTCNAKIITPPGNPKSIAAYYRGTAYEGGYKHEFVGQGIAITTFYLD
jgi:hypothetical protein